MLSSMTSLLLAVVFAASAFASPLAFPESAPNIGVADFNLMTCIELIIPVTINATNLVIPIVPPYPTIHINATYNIGARYCEPILKVRAKTLQILVHGITTNRNYWSADGAPYQGYQPANYSYIKFAALNSFPTLSIDRLGNGLSDHPDPVYATQVNSEVETIHQLILKARAGTLLSSGKKFTKVVYIGHSYGSILGNKLTSVYPQDVDAAVLTGWSPKSTTALAILGGALAPAALVDPVRFGTLPPYYLQTNSTSVIPIFYYAGNYDPALLALDIRIRGTVAYGELVSAGAQPAALAAAFTGPVLLLAGQYDQAYCPEANDVITCGPGGSSPALKASAVALYPAASRFDAISLPNVGHVWNNHYRAPVGFAAIQAWLTLAGF